MRHRYFLSYRIAAAITLIGLACLSWGAEGERPEPATIATSALVSKASHVNSWTATQSISLRRFEPEDIVFSPSRRHFLFVSVHGELGCDCDTYELSVFATEDVRRAVLSATAGSRVTLKPSRVMTRRAQSPVFAAIAHPEWEPGEGSVVFQGLDEQGTRQVYQLDITNGAVTSLTHEVHQSEDIFYRGRTIVSTEIVPKRPDPLPYPDYVATPDVLQQSVFPENRSQRVATFVSHDGLDSWEVTGSGADLIRMPWIARDGRRVVMLRFPASVPASWSRYDRMRSFQGRGDKIDQFVLVDVSKRAAAPVFDAPAGLATQMGYRHYGDLRMEALWAEDQRHAVLVNTAIPITEGGDSRDEHTAYVIGVDADTGQWMAIEPLESQTLDGRSRHIVKVGWLKEGRTLLIQHASERGPENGTVYVLRRGRWIGRVVPPSVSVSRAVTQSVENFKGLSIRLRQGANEPPMVVATLGKKELMLTQPDPVLEGVEWVRSKPFQWKTSNGELQSGGLLLPRAETGPVPLVVQAYAYEPARFEPDGPFLHAYAGQLLAGRGMAVLSINIPGVDDPLVAGTPKEMTEFVDRVNSAADALAKEGIIERSKVGLIGFSRGGFNAYYAITHPGTNPLGAAVIDDAFPGSYDYYLYLKATGRQGDQHERLYGGSFWQNKAGWLEGETTFNVDRVETPALFAIHNEADAHYAIATVGAFELNNKPIDYLVFPYARHYLRAPRQRLASIEASADWMSFWLQQREDPDPRKAGQYERWRGIRARSEAKPSLRKQDRNGHWVFVPDTAPRR